MFIKSKLICIQFETNINDWYHVRILPYMSGDFFYDREIVGVKVAI